MRDECDAVTDLATVSEWSEELLGYEPQTRALDPSDADNLADLLRIAAEAQAAGRTVRLVHDDRGRVAVWQLTNDFYR